jgi:autotransporter-associated beta strand protein
MGPLYKVGTGTLTLTGTNTYGTGVTAAATKVSGGVLAIASDSALGAVPTQTRSDSIVLESGGALSATNSFTLNTARGIQLGSNGGSLGASQGAALTYAGVISSSVASSLSLVGAGQITLSGANTYSGTTNLAAAITQADSPAAFGNASGTISFDGGILKYGSSNTTDYSSRFSNATGQTYRVSVDVANSGVTFATGFSGADASLVKVGSGVLTLAAANTFTGSVAVEQGVLAIPILLRLVLLRQAQACSVVPPCS